MLFSRLLLLTAYATSAFAQWKSLGPGAGGQIQGIYLDPEQPNRVWFTMDVEGAYRTDDGGQNWFNLPRNTVCADAFDVVTKPGSAATVYLGTFWGPLTSQDTGASWALPGDIAQPTSTATELRGDVIGTLAVDPRQPATLYAAPDWRVQNLSFNVLNKPRQNSSDARFIHLSLDSGATWHRSIYEATPGWKQVYSLVPDPLDPAVL
jgi:hypothetical protein